MAKQKISISVYPGQIDALTSVLAGLEKNIDPENTDLEVIDNGTDVAEQFAIMQIVSDFHCRTRGVGFYRRVEIPAVRLNVVQVEIKLLDPAAKVPDYKHLTDSGMDVASIENVTIAPRSFAKIKTVSPSVFPAVMSFRFGRVPAFNASRVSSAVGERWTKVIAATSASFCITIPTSRSK